MADPSVLEQAHDMSLRFEGRLRAVEAELARLHRGLEMLPALERHRGTVLGQRDAVEHARLSRGVRIEAREFLEVGSGFHGLEYGEQGVAYRWTGAAREASVTVWIDRSCPVTVALAVQHFGLSGQVVVDGIAYAQARPAEGGRLEFGPIAVRPGAGPTSVVLASDAMFSPEASSGGDPRQLGIAVRSIEIMPCPA